VIPVEFRGDLWRPKTRVPGVSRGVVCVILRFAVLVELRLVTDRHIQTPTDGNAEIAGLDIAGLDNDGRMCGQLTELKLQNFIP